MRPDQMRTTISALSESALKIETRYETAYRIAHERPRYGEGGGSGVSKPTESAFMASRLERELVEDASHAVEAAYTSLKLGLYAMLKLEDRIDKAHPLTFGIHERQRERPAGRADVAAQYRVKAKELVRAADKIDRQLAVEKKAAEKQATRDKGAAKMKQPKHINAYSKENTQ